MTSVRWRHSGRLTLPGRGTTPGLWTWRPSSSCPGSVAVWRACVVSDCWRGHPRAHAAVSCDHQQPWRRGCRRNLSRSHCRLHRPLHHGQRCHGDLHPGSLRGSQREPRVSDCGEYGRQSWMKEARAQNRCWPLTFVPGLLDSSWCVWLWGAWSHSGWG